MGTEETNAGEPPAEPAAGGLTSAEMIRSLPSRMAERPMMILPFVILLGVTLVVGWFFFLLVQPFILSLIAAAMAALTCYPMHLALTRRLGNRALISAALVTLLLVSLVCVPLIFVVVYGSSELGDGIGYVTKVVEDHRDDIDDWLTKIDQRLRIPPEELKERIGQIGKSAMALSFNWGTSMVGSVIVGVFHFTIGMVAFFFFLLDGEKILRAWELMTPLEVEHDRVIRQEFAQACRGAIWGTVIAAIAQGVAMTIGLGVINLFFHAGLGRWLFLLGGLTSVAAVIPFAGAGFVWLPTSIVLFAQEQHVAAVIVFLYGFLFVSSIDNVIKILVIKDMGNLHPLLVLICVFGGIQLMGVLGVFLGPAIGAVIFALLRVVRKEINRLTAPVESAPHPKEAAPTSAPIKA